MIIDCSRVQTMFRPSGLNEPCAVFGTVFRHRAPRFINCVNHVLIRSDVVVQSQHLSLITATVTCPELEPYVQLYKWSKQLGARVFRIKWKCRCQTGGRADLISVDSSDEVRAREGGLILGHQNSPWVFCGSLVSNSAKPTVMQAARFIIAKTHPPTLSS